METGCLQGMGLGAGKRIKAGADCRAITGKRAGPKNDPSPMCQATAGRVEVSDPLMGSSVGAPFLWPVQELIEFAGQIVEMNFFFFGKMGEEGAPLRVLFLPG